MGAKLYKISAYLNREEMKQFQLWVKMRGVGQSGFIREQLSFEVRPRGAPKGPRQKRAAGQSSPSKKAQPAGKSKVKEAQRAPGRTTQLSLLD